MEIKDISPSEKWEYNALVHHPLQSYEWGEFRKKTGVTVIRKGFFAQGKLQSGFQLTIHHIPHTPWTIGYLPKGDMPKPEMLEELKKIGKKQHCLYIQLEPDVKKQEIPVNDSFLHPSFHPLFTKYSLLLDLTPSEDLLLKHMHPKTRYNIKVAKKHGVEIVQDSSAEAFAAYWKIMQETTTRQKFYAHTQKYHMLQWETLQSSLHRDSLNYHLFLAKYQGKILAAWVLFVFHETLYYPYGSSSSEHRETMASNLLMWEAIRFGKKLGLKTFDMWGSLGPNPEKQDSWYGFHRFKQGYGAVLTEFVGSYDLVIHPLLYQLFKGADKLRWLYLQMKR